MLVPPIYDLCAASTDVTALLSDDLGLKVAEFSAQLVQPPYCCWQIITGSTQQYLAGPSDMDNLLVQIDVYAAEMEPARHIAKAVRKAIENDCYIVRPGGIEQDEKTGLYRVSFDTSWQIDPDDD